MVGADSFWLASTCVLRGRSGKWHFGLEAVLTKPVMEFSYECRSKPTLTSILVFECGLAISFCKCILKHVMAHSLSFPFYYLDFTLWKKNIRANSSPGLTYNVQLWFSLLSLSHMSFSVHVLEVSWEWSAAWVNVVSSAESITSWRAGVALTGAALVAGVQSLQSQQGQTLLDTLQTLEKAGRRIGWKVCLYLLREVIYKEKLTSKLCAA